MFVISQEGRLSLPNPHHQMAGSYYQIHAVQGGVSRILLFLWGDVGGQRASELCNFLSLSMGLLQEKGPYRKT